MRLECVYLEWDLCDECMVFECVSVMNGNVCVVVFGFWCLLWFNEVE